MSKTAKVRVFVSINTEGFWFANGAFDASDAYIMENTEHTPSNGDEGYWLEVDLPIPEEKKKPRKPLNIPVKVFEG